jgi:hypothetical protein
MSVEQIAQQLNVDVEAVRLAAQQNTQSKHNKNLAIVRCGHLLKRYSLQLLSREIRLWMS